MDTLTDLFSSRVKAEVFRLLFGPGGLNLHGREIARRAGLSDATVRQELKRLIRMSLVEVQRDGNRAYYRANTRHPLFPDLRNLVLKTSGMAGVLRKGLDHSGIRLAFVFGSIADGAEKPESDVDLMVIGDIGLRQLSRVIPNLAMELGREINPHILTPKELVRRKSSHDHFLTTVLAGPKLFVIGDEHDLAAMG